MANDGTANIAITTNETLWVLSADAAAKLWLIMQEEQRAITADQGKDLWQKLKDNADWAVGKTAAYYSTGLDILTVQRIIKDFGTMFGRVYFKDIQGAPHIILKGYPGLRQVLTSPKYGVNNPKVVAMGLGRAGAMKSIKEGGILTIVLVTAYNVIDYVLTDNMTLADLVGQIAGDVVKIGIAAGIGAAVVAVTFGTVVSSFALGPLLVAIVITVGVGLVLDWIDDQIGFTKKLKAMLAPMLNPVEDAVREKVQQTKEGLIDWAYDGLCAFVGRIIDAAEEKAAGYLWRKIKDLRWYSVPTLR
jgi:hypothetical protein